MPMETPQVVSVEEHQSWRTLHSVAFSTQESSVESAATSDNGSPDHREDNPITEDQSLMVEPDKDLPNLNKSCAFDSVESMETVCFQESKAVLGDKTLRSSQLVEDVVSVSTASIKNCCSRYPPPASAADILTNQTAQKPHALTINCNSECTTKDVKKLEPVSNGSVFSLDSNLALEVPAKFVRGVLDLPHVVRQKQSTITFSENTCSSSASSHVFSYGSSDGGESSQEGEKEEDDDDDVFVELPYSEDIFTSARQKSTDKNKQKRIYCVGAQGEVDHTLSSSSYEAEEETSSKEESTQVNSPWSESMSQLMKKLDQLNQDIEEALSANSSPSDTPCIPRKKLWDGVSKPTLSHTPNDKVAQGLDERDCQSRDKSSAYRSSSTGIRTRTKKTGSPQQVNS